MESSALPFTEQADPLTTGIDLAPGAERVRLLAEGVRLLIGVPGHPSVLAETTLAACVRAADGARDVLRAPRGALVLAGAGTSGRLAFLVARLFNDRLVRAGLRPALRPLVAGGPRALAVAAEGAEDD
jgi:N-acetylmuramic acid 6-phosphate (MurNAc-6-P) etherase